MGYFWSELERMNGEKAVFIFTAAEYCIACMFPIHVSLTICHHLIAFIQIEPKAIVTFGCGTGGCEISTLRSYFGRERRGAGSQSRRRRGRAASRSRGRPASAARTGRVARMARAKTLAGLANSTRASGFVRPTCVTVEVSQGRWWT